MEEGDVEMGSWRDGKSERKGWWLEWMAFPSRSNRQSRARAMAVSQRSSLVAIGDDRS